MRARLQGLEPSTLDPEPGIPRTPNLKPPLSVNPHPSTLNSQPSTQSSTLDHQPSTLNPQPSTLYPQPSSRSLTYGALRAILERFSAIIHQVLLPLSSLRYLRGNGPSKRFWSNLISCYGFQQQSRPATSDKAATPCPTIHQAFSSCRLRARRE